MKAIFEGAWNEATQFVFEQQAAQQDMTAYGTTA
jgi:hypothetical protein